MSFLKKTLASFGIGSAKVDSVLQQEVLYPGKKASIIVHVYGGAQPQEIDNIDLNLCCRYVKEVTMNSQRQEGGQTRRMHQTYSLAKWSLPYAFVIQPGETRDFECEFDVPLNTPVTIGDSKGISLDTLQVQLYGKLQKHVGQRALEPEMKWYQVNFSY